MNKRYISTFMFILAAATASAQNLDPTVRVTRDYKASLQNVSKPSIQMEIPDSAYDFKVSFDYSVSELDYSGTDSFNPYRQDIKPQSVSFGDNRMYLNAGVGYDIRPTFDFVYNWRRDKDFRLGVYASHDSYIGNYRTMDVERKEAVYVARTSDERWKGYDISSRAGVQGIYAWSSGFLTFDVCYDGLLTKDASAYKGSWNSAKGDVRVRSNRDAERYFYYDADVEYVYSRENNRTDFGEHDINIIARFGPMLSYNHGFMMDVKTNLSVYGSEVESYCGNWSFSPKYVLHRNQLTLEAGLALEFLLKPTFINVGELCNQHKGRVAYPALNADFALIRDKLDLYAEITGGNSINSYSTVKKNNHWFNSSYIYRATALLDNTVNRFSLKGGVRGNLKNRFHYDLYGGFGMWDNAPLDMFWGSLSSFCPVIVWSAYNMARCGVECSLELDKLQLGASFLYRYTNILKTNALGLEPSRYSGTLEATYHWGRRMSASLSAEAASNRNAHSEYITGSLFCAQVPWYADLGLNCTYKVGRNLSLWLEGGNLLNMPIQRSLFYVQRGINGRVGLTWNVL